MNRTVLSIALALGAAPLAAQEVAVPFDSAGRLEVIDRALERRLGLFGDVAGFVEARLFAAADGTFVLEITHRVDGRLARIRRTLSAAEADAFRRRVMEALALSAPNALINQSGRGELLRGTFALALGYYSFAMPVALDVDDGRSAIGVGTITAAGSFFVPLALTAHAQVTRGQASLALWGGTRGILHGMMTAAFFDEGADRAILGYGLVGSVAEGVAGYALAGRSGIAQGHADAMGMLGDIGGGMGLAGAYVLSPDNGTDHDGIWAAGILGSFAGVYAGHRLASWEPTTRGDVGVFRAATLVGSWVGFATTYLVAHERFRDPGRNEVGGALVGTGVGLVAAQVLTHDRQFSTADGTIASISALGGGLLGAGLGYLATPNGNDDDQAVIVASAAGATLGFGIVYAALQGDARDADRLERVSLTVNPAALALRGRGAAGPVPVVAVGVTF